MLVPLIPDYPVSGSTERGEAALQKFSCLFQKDVNERQSEQSDWFTMLSEEDNIRALTIALTFVSLEQLSGSAIVLMTLHTLLSESRVRTNLSVTVIAVAMFLAAVAVPPLIRKYDRKKPLIGSSIVLALSMVSFGAFYFYLKISGWGQTPRLVSTCSSQSCYNSPSSYKEIYLCKKPFYALEVSMVSFYTPLSEFIMKTKSLVIVILSLLHKET